VLTAVAKAKIQQVCLVTNHLAKQIEQYVGDGSRWDLSAVFCHQTQLLGTAHALNTAVKSYPGLFQDKTSFLLTATDYILPEMFLADLVQAYTQNGSDITVSLKVMPQACLSDRSSVTFAADGGITQIVEKPAAGQAPSEFVASLMIIFPAAVSRYLNDMIPSQRGEYELQSVINQMIVNGFRAQGIVQTAPEEWEPPL